MLKGYHVVPNPNGGWDVKPSGGERAIKHFPTKQPAIDYGRQVSHVQEAELFVHGKDGQFQSRDSHGKDPYPPKG